ncbi:MAG: 2-hydroxychromene-2-carboxylate isomerase [Myxococcota bacterium]
MKIPFYFDYACPWAYLGSTRVESYFADLGVEIDFRPVRLADLVENPGEKRGLPPGERRRAWYVADLNAWAELVGADFELTAGGRRPDTRLLCQAALVAQDHGHFREFHYPAYRARWAEGRAVDEAEVVGELLEGAGLDADAALAEARSDACATRLDATTREAIERGVFGVPTLFVGERMLFGNDRFELARHFVQKQAL